MRFSEFYSFDYLKQDPKLTPEFTNLVNSKIFMKNQHLRLKDYDRLIGLFLALLLILAFFINYMFAETVFSNSKSIEAKLSLELPFETIKISKLVTFCSKNQRLH